MRRSPAVTRRSQMSRNDPLTDCVEDQFRNAVEVEFLQDVSPMSFHRGQADIEEARDFLVGSAFGNQLQNFALAVREQLVAVFETAPPELADVVLLQHRADLAGKESASLRDRSNSLDHFPTHGVL